MIDIKILRSEPQKIKTSLEKRGGRYLPVFGEICKKDAEYKATLKDAETGRSRKNAISREIGSFKMKKLEVPKRLEDEVQEIKKNLSLAEARLQELEKELQALLLTIPNILNESVPPGAGEVDNKIIFEDISAKREFSFKPLDHHALGEKLDILDFERAAKLSGSRFALLKGRGARLERAIAQFMLDLHTGENGYTEMFTPFLVNSRAMTGTGQLPKFEEDLYRTASEPPLYLVPTAEVPLTNIHSGETLSEAELPKKFTACTACFRQEAGSYGKDTRGLIRNHQFNKVELVWLTKPEDSAEALVKMKEHAEKVLQLLGLPYRILELCGADVGFSSSKTYDLEVWMPSENRFREISSCSNCGDFQARRMNMQFKRSGGGTEHVHTLNGSGLAVGRTFAAILENFQQEGGSVVIPEVLRKYTGFDKIG